MTLTKQYGLKSKNWVKWYKENGTVYSTNKGKNGRGRKGIPNPMKRKKTHFNSVEEERDYLKQL
ncbi:hypothetical protein [Niallia sp. NCCP-28]|uniref:hypothetical protein n=1 Tax=Niallia sp. NCCP-28 TaxID=2934712 RepID=UPI00208880D3|nr:hypothetical protein [Niallia sp. NCCP-28]GKU85174.1 hypothetical protein NCCP28_45700 [Niallia sp. NCCP-28]